MSGNAGPGGSVRKVASCYRIRVRCNGRIAGKLRYPVTVWSRTCRIYQLILQYFPVSGFEENWSAFQISDCHARAALHSVVTAALVLIAAHKWRCDWLEHVKHALQGAGDMSGGSLDRSGLTSVRLALAWLTMRTWLALGIGYGAYEYLMMISVFLELLLQAL